jgi:uroporphyrinogen-III decarboxylase
MPGIALMGNVPPLSIMACGTPEETESWARECVCKTGGHQLILSAGGGASPGTLPETVDALTRVAMATEIET